MMIEPECVGSDRRWDLSGATVGARCQLWKIDTGTERVGGRSGRPRTFVRAGVVSGKFEHGRFQEVSVNALGPWVSPERLKGVHFPERLIRPRQCRFGL